MAPDRDFSLIWGHSLVAGAGFEPTTSGLCSLFAFLVGLAIGQTRVFSQLNKLSVHYEKDNSIQLVTPASPVFHKTPAFPVFSTRLGIHRLSVQLLEPGGRRGSRVRSHGHNSPSHQARPTSLEPTSGDLGESNPSSRPC